MGNKGNWKREFPNSSIFSWYIPYKNDFIWLSIRKTEYKKGYDLGLDYGNKNQYFAQEILKQFDTKKQAVTFALNYMRSHPNG